MTEAPVPVGLLPHRRLNVLLNLGARLARIAPGLSTACDVLVRIVFSADIPSRMNVPTRVTFMHNGLGTVVDERVRFEGSAMVFQHVTLGFAYGNSPQTGTPTIGDGVLIGVGASVLGPVNIGHDAVVAAGSVVTRDVPPLHYVGRDGTVTRRTGVNSRSTESGAPGTSDPDTEAIG